MHVSSYANGEGYVVEVKGDLTADQPLGDLLSTVKRVLNDKSPPIVKVKVREVELVDLEGIAALAHSYRLAKNGGARFGLIDGQPRLRNRLKQTGLLELLEDEAR